MYTIGFTVNTVNGNGGIEPVSFSFNPTSESASEGTEDTGALTIHVSGYVYELKLGEDDISIKQGDVQFEDEDQLKDRILRMVEPSLSREYIPVDDEDTDPETYDWTQDLTYTDFSIDTEIDMTKIFEGDPFEVEVSYTVYEGSPEDTSGEGKKLSQTATVTINPEVVSWVDVDRTVVSLDVANANTDNWANIIKDQVTAVHGNTPIEDAEITDIVVEDFDGEEGIYHVTFEYSYTDPDTDETVVKTVSYGDILYVVDTNGGELAYSDGLDYFVVFEHTSVALSEMSEDMIDGHLSNSIKRVLRVDRNESDKTLATLVELEDYELEFDTEELLSQTEAHPGVGVTFAAGPVVANPLVRTLSGNLPVEGTMNVAVTDEQEPVDVDDDDDKDDKDSDLTTGADNVDGPSTSGKNLPSTGEQLSNAGLFGAGLLGLGGLAAWLRKRRKSSK